MLDLTRMFQQLGNSEERSGMSGVYIKLASSETIRSWSYGEVKKAETINYRTLRPERDGLFCAKIFGPVKDYECLCGKYKKSKYRGVVCEKCGVEVTQSRVRRSRMGHIDLVSPVAHVWFLKSLPSKLGIMLDIPLRDIEYVLYFEAYIVIEVLDRINTPLHPKDMKQRIKMGDILSPEQYNMLVEDGVHDKIRIGIGAEAIKDILKAIDLDNEIAKLKEESKNAKSESVFKKIHKRLKAFEGLKNSGARPEWMILDVLPVLPPELRPLVALDGGRFATSDLNDLYRRVINRNNRLKKLIQLRAPEIILRNERRMLQEAVDSLFDNGRRGRAITTTNKRPFKSLADIIKGKSGRFRQNLLGKRVDYSGRSVITVGPNLKLYQCGIPKIMALELFKPFVYSKLQSLGIAYSIKHARDLIEDGDAVVWDVLEELIREHPVLLNRAPTLHRLGIQAFEPLLIEGKAIQLHPLVCTAFNADFDGDQMAVHIPLGIEAQMEARTLMLASNNLLSPASGEPIVVPSKDIILGLYYLTREKLNSSNRVIIFASVDEAENAYLSKQIELHTRVWVKISDGQNAVKRNTTIGRAILSRILPSGIPFEIIDRPLKKKDVAKLIGYIFRHCSLKDTAIFVDKLMYLGFKYTTISGISICVDDMLVPAEKHKLINKANQEVNEIYNQYQDGLVTQGERYNKVVDIWSKCGEEISRVLMDKLSKEDIKLSDGKVVSQDSFNPIFMMADSGACGSTAQIKQLAGMRGLMAKPDGSIIETPITANFRDGLTVLQYFISTHGARKGLSDTALKTANSGYLTRRLVDVTQNLIITDTDCKTTNGMTVKPVVQGGDIVISLIDKINGRVTLEDVVNVKNGELIAKRDTLINLELAEKIVNAGIDEVKVRTVLTCDSRHGICAKCYGMDLARGGLVNTGEAVGIIAAQSIGEPGTQLTMRTFHIGGAASRSTIANSIKSKFAGRVKYKNLKFVKNKNGVVVVISRLAEILIMDDYDAEKEKHKIPYGAYLFVNDDQRIEAGFEFANWDPHARPIVSEYNAKIKLENIYDGITVVKESDEITGTIILKVIDPAKIKGRVSKDKLSLRPIARLLDEENNQIMVGDIPAVVAFRIGDIIVVKDGQTVSSGDILAKKPHESLKTRDITGGLPRVAELFEARIPNDHGILSEMSGTLSFQKETKGKQKIKITALTGESTELSISKDRNILMNDGEYVEQGQMIVDGPIDPNELLKMKGIEELCYYITNEVQEVYRLQGVKIDNKHIEVVLKQMLRRVYITDTGDSANYLVGDTAERSNILQENDKLLSEGKNPIVFKNILLGITKAALSTDSFISAASFQETTRVLTEAALVGKVDNLIGLKENVIVGSLIPAGTGFIKRALNLKDC